MSFRIYVLISFLILPFAFISISFCAQPSGVELDPDGVSKILWMFDTPQNTWINTKTMGQDGHQGDDYYADDWSRANAEQTVKGQIAYAGISGKAIVPPFDAKGYGNHVVIYDSSSRFALRYAHLDEILVVNGQEVVAGITPVGKVGNTGNVSGPTGYHLHVVLYKNVTSERGRPITEVIYTGKPTIYAAPFLYNPRKLTQIERPQPPIIISPGTKSEPGEIINTLTPIFRWNAVANAEKYGLFISKYPYGTENIIFRKEDLTGTSFTLPAGFLEDGTKYRWNMQAYNSAGWGNVSERLYFEVKLATAVKRTLTIASTEVSPGSKTTVQISISDAAGMDSADIKIKYSQNVLTVINAKTTSLTQAMSLVTNTNIPGEITLAIAGVEGIKSGSGSLIDIEFTARSNAQPGTETPIEFINAFVYVSGKSVPVDLRNGAVKIVGTPITTTQRVISISSVDTAPNSTTTVQVKVDNAKDLAAGDLIIKYDSNSLTIEEIKGTSLISGMNLVFNTNVLGKIMIGIAGAQGIPSGSGALVEITITMKPGVKSGSETTLTFDSNTQIYDEMGTVIPVKLESGVVRIRGIKGDVNNDGKIASNDALLTLRIAIGLIVPDEYQKWAADMNNDGKINSADAIAILRITVGLPAPRSEMPPVIASETIIRFADPYYLAGKLIIPLIAENFCNIAGGDISIAYDNRIFRVVDISVEQGLLSASDISKPGRIRLAFVSYGILSKGTIAEIKFEVIADSDPLLRIEDTELYRWDGSPVNSKNLTKKLNLQAMVPQYNALLQNFPNPFNPETWIPYQLKEGCEVTVRIYSMTGELVKEFDLGYKPAGLYISRDRALHWDGKNQSGEKISSGVYFYTIQTPYFSDVRKMVVSE